MVDLTHADVPAAERVRALAGHPQATGIAFQSIAVAGARILFGVLQRERQVATATISLGQREKLQGMVETLEQTYASVCDSVSAPCGKALDVMSTKVRAADIAETSWWFALTEAIEALEEGIEAMTALVGRQPKGGASRILGGIIVRLLHRHRSELLREAEQWIVLTRT